jgi:hypothetical protein
MGYHMGSCLRTPVVLTIFDATIPFSRLCICIFLYCLFNLFSDLSCFVAFQADIFSHLLMLVHWYQTQIIWLISIYTFCLLFLLLFSFCFDLILLKWVILIDYICILLHWKCNRTLSCTKLQNWSTISFYFTITLSFSQFFFFFFFFFICGRNYKIYKTYTSLIIFCQCGFIRSYIIFCSKHVDIIITAHDALLE